MSYVIQPFHLLVITLAGWLNRHQQAVIEYLLEENCVLKDQLGGRLSIGDSEGKTGTRITVTWKAQTSTPSNPGW